MMASWYEESGVTSPLLLSAIVKVFRCCRVRTVFLAVPGLGFLPSASSLECGGGTGTERDLCWLAAESERRDGE